MQIHAPEGLKRIRALVSSLDGVVGCGIETQDGGAIRTLRVSTEPGVDPDALARTIRSALSESLEVYLGPEQLSVRPQPTARRSAGPASEEDEGDDRGSQAREARRPQAPSGTGPLRFGGYALFGDPAGPVELRVRVATADGVFEGSSREVALDRVTAETFVSAALRAAELALDARPVDDRSSRILILEQDAVEEAELDDGPFLAVTVRALYRRGRRSATGFEPLRGSARDAAARAALDAVQRILEGRDPASRSENRGGAGSSGSGSDPFFTWS